MSPGPGIGIFDSGVGGLTVVRAVMDRLPRESVIYFGDTARVPYGSKSPETVIRFARESAAFLAGKGIKLLVVACNTASAVSIPALRQEFDLPIVGVIEPGALFASRATGSGRVGVIGTIGTISSGAYQNALRECNSSIRVIAQPCPLLVPLVEEGWLDHEITRLVVEEYTRPLVAEGIDTLVLGCTHYPLLKPVLSRVLGDGVRLVDSAEATAEVIGDTLRSRGLLRGSEETERPDRKFYVSDIPLKFQEIAQRFLGAAVPLVTQIKVGE
ncbi:glutamate racemase [Candidatus Fermentibacterales bacterium]|nr:glutamate racemase [Candidatus Fermentibacterales bacterium]